MTKTCFLIVTVVLGEKKENTGRERERGSRERKMDGRIRGT